MSSHHSKSGLCRVISHMEPEPRTAAQERARLLHKLALIEGRIAARETYVSAHSPERCRQYTNGVTQLGTLLKQRDATVSALRSFGE